MQNIEKYTRYIERKRYDVGTGFGGLSIDAFDLCVRRAGFASLAGASRTQLTCLREDAQFREVQFCTRTYTHL